MGCLGIGPSTSGCRSVMKVATMPRSGVPGMIRLMMNANGMRPWRMDGRYRATCCTGRGIVTTSIAPNVNAARPAGIFFLSLRYVGPRTRNGAALPGAWIDSQKRLSHVHMSWMRCRSSGAPSSPSICSFTVGRPSCGAERSRGDSLPFAGAAVPLDATGDFWLIPGGGALGSDGSRSSSRMLDVMRPRRYAALSSSCSSTDSTVASMSAATMLSGLSLKRECSTSSRTRMTLMRIRSRKASVHPNASANGRVSARLPHAPRKSSLMMTVMSVSGLESSWWPSSGASV
mmetsp:Transcript_38405/g.113919  ORF Transcript_38405/g.113919 Transcript_38405/m.113919 type:complete len:288 (-) Transcript_38405:1664-2527(-)